MRIIVCIKQVPDTSEVRIDPQTKNLVRDGVPGILNPYDENAIEMALSIRDSVGGTVVLLSMGPRQAIKELERGLGMGADRAILLSDRRLGGSDTLATGYALSYVIEKIGYDLILCGNEAIDGCTGQVGPSIAEHLGIPAFTCARDVNIFGNKAQVKRDTHLNYDIYEAKLPVLACILKDANMPRQSKRPHGEVEILDASGMEPMLIGLDGSPTRVAQIFMSERLNSYVDIDSSLSCEERIELIINGGIQKKEYKLIRGSVEKLADALMAEGDLSSLAGL